MKTAVKVLCIIALIIGIIWATVGFFKNLFGASVSAGVSLLLSDKSEAESIEKSASLMLKHIVGFIVVIIAGVLGIVGSDKESVKTKTVILGLLTLLFGCFLFPLNNYVAAPIYVLAGLLLFIDGAATTKAYSSVLVRKCPHCANEIKMKTVVCQFCNKDIPFIPSHKVKLLTNSEGLILRRGPYPRTKPFTKLPDGTEIECLETGPMTDLNGIKAPWFKILTKENICGWCFSGSLEKI